MSPLNVSNHYNYWCVYAGLKKQQEQLPIQFILERLWEGASVVLTGETSFLLMYRHIDSSYWLLFCVHRVFIWRDFGTVLCHIYVESEPRHLPGVT